VPELLLFAGGDAFSTTELVLSFLSSPVIIFPDADFVYQVEMVSTSSARTAAESR
jgi:hypothetical protein